MDNLTHTLFALTLARTPLGRGTGTTAALVIASSAPDIDVVAAFDGGSAYLRWHRGPTHGALGVLGLGVVTAALVWGAYQLAARAGRRPAVAPRGAPPFAAVLVASLVGVLAHILMDVPTAYGTRLFSPFTWRWFSVDLLPIIDVYLLAALTAGLLVGARDRNARRARAASAAIVLSLMGVNYVLRGAAHQRALALAAEVFEARLPPPCGAGDRVASLVSAWPRTSSPAAGGGRCLIEMAAIPTFLSPFRWRVIAQSAGDYDVYDIDLLDERLRAEVLSPDVLAQLATRLPNRWTPQVIEAASAPAAQVLLGFSRFPWAQVDASPGGGSTVVFSDIRFIPGAGDPAQLRARRTELFTAAVPLAPGDAPLPEGRGQ